MPELLWDLLEDRVYQTGLDRGVLYLPDGSGIPWNGLTSIIEKFDSEVSPVYYDGQKISNLVSVGDFSATLRAITYPDEFDVLEGLGELRHGAFVGDQRPKSFGLCYRTKIGNAVQGDDLGYKIHLLYNVIALPSDKNYSSISNSVSLTQFEWDLFAVPEAVPGFRPTAHFIIDTRDLDPWLLKDIEEKLYGSTDAIASLIPMADLIAFINEWVRIKIVDNGDGTWSASAEREGLITVYAGEDPVTIVDNGNGTATISSVGDGGVDYDPVEQKAQIIDVSTEEVGEYKVTITDDFESYFHIIQANVIYFDDVTYIISDTKDIKDTPRIKFIDNGDGTWTAVTAEDGLFKVGEDGYFEISDANAAFIGTTMYVVSNTE